jgi:hypothetical protein
MPPAGAQTPLHARATGRCLRSVLLQKLVALQQQPARTQTSSALTATKAICVGYAQQDMVWSSRFSAGSACLVLL